MTIRVLVVDDHAVVRAGLRMLIDAEDDMETVAEAGTVREAIFEARSSSVPRRSTTSGSSPRSSG